MKEKLRGAMMNILRIKMTDAGNLLKELDDALDKVVPKKRAREFSQADRLTNRGLPKECQANSSAIHRRAAIQ